MYRILAAIIMTGLVAVPAADATELVFDLAGGGFSESYGDRADSFVDGDFFYGNYLGWTPNVSVEYIEDAGTSWSVEGGGYGTLDNVLVLHGTELDEEYTFTIKLRADPGYLVALKEFKLATVYTSGFDDIKYNVMNAHGQIVAGNSTLTLGLSPEIVSMGSAPILSREFQINVKFVTSAGLAPIGIDDLYFGQVKRRGYELGQVKSGSSEESSWSDVKGLFR